MSWTRCLAFALCCHAASASAGEISVLLPLTGPAASASESIRNGLLAAYYQALSQQKTSDNLVFYDTTGYQDISALLPQAVNAQTRLVIGPLLKEHVSQMLANPPSIPVLALNRVNTGNGGNVWQYALAPEEEFQPLARMMQQQGIKRVRVLAQTDANSERLRQGFEQVWQAGGGELLPAYTLTQTSADGLTLSIKKLLAEPQHSKTQAFYLASPQLALYTLPLLNFYQRSPLPVFSPSQSYDAEKSLLERQDLNGLRFCGLPWIIQPEQWPANQTLRDNFTPASSSFDRLAAFGADAWMISQQLTAPKKRSMAGRTGTLALIDGQVLRTPVCAEIINGKAQAYTATTGPTR